MQRAVKSIIFVKLTLLALTFLIQSPSVAFSDSVSVDMEGTPIHEGYFSRYMKMRGFRAFVCTPRGICYNSEKEPEPAKAIYKAFDYCASIEKGQRNGTPKECRLAAIGDQIVWALSPADQIRAAEAYLLNPNRSYDNMRSAAKALQVGFAADDLQTDYSNFAASVYIDQVKIAKNGGHFLTWTKEQHMRTIRLWRVTGDSAQSIAKFITPNELYVMNADKAFLSDDGQHILIGTRGVGSIPRVLHYEVETNTNRFIQHPVFKNKVGALNGDICGLAKHPHKYQVAVCWRMGNTFVRARNSHEVWLQDIVTGDSASMNGGAFLSSSHHKYNGISYSSDGSQILTTLLSDDKGFNLGELRHLGDSSKRISEFYGRTGRFLGNDHLVVAAKTALKVLNVSTKKTVQRENREGLNYSGNLSIAIAAPSQLAISDGTKIVLYTAPDITPIKSFQTKGIREIAWNPSFGVYVGVGPKQVQFFKPPQDSEIAGLVAQNAAASNIKKGIAEAKELFNNGFVEEGADQFKALLKTGTKYRDWNSALDWYTPELNQGEPELLRYLGEMLLAQSRYYQNVYGAEKFLYANARLFDYGVAASMAGQSGITSQVAARLQKAATQAPSAKIGKRIGQYAGVLGGLAAADNGKSKQAYKALLNAKIKGDNFLVGVRLKRPAMFGSLYSNRKKLSFVTGIGEADLPQQKTTPVRPSKFPNLKGNYVKTAGSVGAKLIKTPAKPKPSSNGSKKKKATVLD